MTRQAMHKLTFQGSELDIMRDGRLLESTIGKIIPVWNLPRDIVSSGTERIAKLQVQDNQLFVNELNILGLSDPSLDIDGVKPVEQFRERPTRDRDRRKGITTDTIVESTWWFKYKSLNIHIPFSGKMLVGKPYSKELPYLVWHEMYPYVCDPIVRLTFSGGDVTRVEDFSDEARQIRASLSENFYELSDEQKKITGKFRVKVENITDDDVL